MKKITLSIITGMMALILSAQTSHKLTTNLNADRTANPELKHQVEFKDSQLGQSSVLNNLSMKITR